MFIIIMKWGKKKRKEKHKKKDLKERKEKENSFLLRIFLTVLMLNFNLN